MDQTPLDGKAVKLALSGDGVFPKDWGTNVARMRKTRGLTQTDLAELIGADLSTISRIEGGGIRPSIYHMVMLAHALNTKPGRLFPLPSGDKLAEYALAAA